MNYEYEYQWEKTPLSKPSVPENSRVLRVLCTFLAIRKKSNWNSNLISAKVAWKANPIHATDMCQCFANGIFIRLG